MIFQKSQIEKIKGWKSSETFSWILRQPGWMNSFLVSTTCTHLLVSLQSSRSCHTPCMKNGSLKHLITMKNVTHHTHPSPSSPSLFLTKPKGSMIQVKGETLVGVAWRILDGMLLKVHSPSLTHEVLLTLIEEVVIIMNARPIVPVSSDPEMPTMPLLVCP